MNDRVNAGLAKCRFIISGELALLYGSESREEKGKDEDHALSPFDRHGLSEMESGKDRGAGELGRT